MRVSFITVSVTALFTLVVAATVSSGQSLSPLGPRTVFDRSCRRFNDEEIRFMDINFTKKDLNRPRSQKAVHHQYTGTLTVLAQHDFLGRVQKPITFTVTRTDIHYLIETSAMEQGWNPVYTRHFLVVPERHGSADPTFTWYDMKGSHWLDFFQAGSSCEYDVNYGDMDLVTFHVARMT